MARPWLICCIPGCPRKTRRYEGGEWICHEHWRREPLATRRAQVRAKRLEKSVEAKARLWARCKRLAGDAFMDFV